MGLVRKFAVLVLTVLLVSTLVTGNLLAAAHLTVLDPNFVQNAVEEEGGYDLIEDAAVQSASSQVPAEINQTVDTESLIRDAINQSYLEDQTEQNVDRLYEYLHGNRDELNLSIETRPLKSDIEVAVESQVRNASIPELLEQSDTELPGPINQSTVERMTESQSGYQAVKQDFRDRIRNRILDEAVETAWQQTGTDEKLALVIPDYDPRDYSESEKEQLVADREDEIRSALRQQIEEERGDEIDQQVDTALAEVNETATTDTGDAEGLEAAALDIQSTYVEGLTTDMTYDELQSELDAAKADAAVAVGDQTEATLDEELPDRISLTEEMDASAMQGFEQARNTVQWIDRAAIILPVLVLVLVGLVFLVTRSFQTVAGSLGFSLLVAGLPIYLSLGTLQSMVEQTVEQEVLTGDPTQLVEAGVDLMLGIVAQLFGRVGTVSLAFTLVGAALLAVWLALRFGVIGDNEEEERTAADAAADADAEAMDDEPDRNDADDEVLEDKEN